MINHLARREFIALLGGAAVATSASWPFAGRAQQSPGKIPVVGVLWHAASADEEDVYLSVLVRAFHDLGYVDGKNIRLEHRFPAENPDRFRACARELVESKNWHHQMVKDASAGCWSCLAATLARDTLGC